MSFLGPKFLVVNIEIYALILAAVILVLFSDFINRHLVFPFADGVRDLIHDKVSSRRKRNHRREKLASILGATAGTAIFILYCYFGSYVLAEYIFEPILMKLRDFILLVLIGLFILIAKIIQDDRLRRVFMKF